VVIYMMDYINRKLADMYKRTLTSLEKKQYGKLLEKGMRIEKLYKEINTIKEESIMEKGLKEGIKEIARWRNLASLMSYDNIGKALVKKGFTEEEAIDILFTCFFAAKDECELS